MMMMVIILDLYTPCQAPSLTQPWATLPSVYLDIFLMGSTVFVMEIIHMAMFMTTTMGGVGISTITCT